MAGANQPRDWRGRWTTGGGASFRPSNSRSTRVRGGTATVTRLRNGRPTRPGRVATRLATGNTVMRRVGVRPGTPVLGNKNVRYIATGHLATRAVPLRNVGVRAGARYGSRRISRAARTPVGGYVVSYSPKG